MSLFLRPQSSACSRVVRDLVLLFLVLLAPLGYAAERTWTDVENQVVKLPERPQRVAALSEIDLDISLALGLKPIATTNGRGQKALPHYLKTANGGLSLDAIRIVGDLGRPNMEALVALKPDLILTAPTRPEILALLRKIAPTAVTFKNGDDWKVVMKRVATVLNREAEERAFMAAYDSELQATKAKLATVPGKTVSIVRWNPNGPAFMFRDAFASLVLRDMGLERPASQQVEGQRHSMPISLEALNMIDADWLFVGTLDPTGEAADAMKEIAKNPSFLRLEAVKTKRYFAVDGSKWTSVGGPLAARSIVKEVSDMMVGVPR